METAGRAWVVGAAARDVVEEAAVREVLVEAAVRDVVEEAAVREVVVVSVSKCMEPDRLGGTLHWRSVLLDGLRSTGCRRASVMCLQKSQG